MTAQKLDGSATLKTRLGNIVAPGLLDRLLSTTKQGYDAQQTDEPVDLATWRDNVDEPVDDDRDHGAHGVFDDTAKPYSTMLWATMHKPLVSGVLGAGLALPTDDTGGVAPAEALPAGGVAFAEVGVVFPLSPPF